MAVTCVHVADYVSQWPRGRLDSGETVAGNFAVHPAIVAAYRAQLLPLSWHALCKMCAALLRG